MHLTAQKGPKAESENAGDKGQDADKADLVRPVEGHCGHGQGAAEKIGKDHDRGGGSRIFQRLLQDQIIGGRTAHS